jgi:hypothetical protein
MRSYLWYLPLDLVNQFRRGTGQVVFRTTTKVSALILWHENIYPSRTRNGRVKGEGNSLDVTENVQNGYRQPLNTPCILEGIRGKHAEVRQPKSEKPSF